MRRRYVLANMVSGLLSGVLLSTGQFAWGSAEPTGGVVRYGEKRRFRALHRGLVDADGVEMKSLEVWLPVPTDWPEQRVLSVDVSPKMKPSVSRDGVTQVARLVVTSAAGLRAGQFELQVTSEFERQEVITDLRRLYEEKYQPYDETDQEYRRYLKAETDVDPGFGPFQELAVEFKGDQRPWAHVAYDIYGWVLDHVSYENISWVGAEDCYRHQRGACGEYAALFVAICRAAGIPARINTGYWADKTDGMHIWAEFLLPSGEWIPVDPSVGDGGDPASPRGVQTRERNFGFLSNRRLTLCKAADVVLKKVSVHPGRVNILQVGAFWCQTGGGMPEVTFRMESQEVSE